MGEELGRLDFQASSHANNRRQSRIPDRPLEATHFRWMEITSLGQALLA